MSLGIGSFSSYVQANNWGSRSYREVRDFSPTLKTLEKPPEEDEEQTLAAAVQAWKEQLLKGLGAMTEDEIQERVEEFRELITREDATEEELKEIGKLVAEYEWALRRAVESMHRESLIITAADSQRQEQDKTASFLQSRMLSALMPPQKEADHTPHNIKKMFTSYESNLSHE